MLLTGGVYPREQPIMRDGLNRVDLGWEGRDGESGIVAFRMMTFLGGESIRPALGEYCIDAALYDRVYHASRHCVRIRDHDTAKSNVDDSLANGMRVVDECDKVSGRGPLLLGRVVGVVEEPIPFVCQVSKRTTLKIKSAPVTRIHSYQSRGAGTIVGLKL
jgi:hypothetical protein